MVRLDHNMPFLLRYENIAWYESGCVRILDRRVFPTEKKYVTCRSYRNVIQAIADMVTQSAGPYTAVGMGMALAAYECSGQSQESQIAFLNKAAEALAQARPTTAHRYRAITMRCADLAKQALEAGANPIETIVEDTILSLNRRYARMQLIGNYLIDQIADNSAILTQCYAETVLGALMCAAREKGRSFRVFCAETRPYLQGARLTASCFSEMGFETTLLTDNMIAYAMENCGIELFTSAADTIAMSGHIANKVGTLQIAILAKHFGLPYFVTGIPDLGKLTAKDIVVEQRDPSLVLEIDGKRITAEGVGAIYPAFDIVPPHLISGVVTDSGILSPYALGAYAETNIQSYY